MKRLLLIVLPLLLIVGCSQKPVDETTLIEKDGVMYLPNSDNLILVKYSLIILLVKNYIKEHTRMVYYLIIHI